jgi:hypothetical protein
LRRIKLRGVALGEAVEDGQCGQGGSGAADAAVAGDLNAFAVTCTVMGGRGGRHLR